MLPLVWAYYLASALAHPFVVGALEYKVEFFEWEAREGTGIQDKFKNVLILSNLPSNAKLVCTVTTTGKAGEPATAEAKIGDQTYGFVCKTDWPSDPLRIEMEPGWRKRSGSGLGSWYQRTHMTQTFLLGKPFLCLMGAHSDESGNRLTYHAARVTVSRQRESGKDD